jgi:hypothetical protein
MIEPPIDRHNIEPVEQDDGISIAVEGLSGRMVECLDVESEVIKGTKLLPIALALAAGKTQAHIAKECGCDQSQVSRAKREIHDRLQASGFGPKRIGAFGGAAAGALSALIFFTVFSASVRLLSLDILRPPT